MDEEIHTIKHDKLKAYHALTAMGDGFPAIGIVAAVLGVVKAMGALDQSPEILGGLIGAALVGTFLGIFMSYCVVGPIATKIKNRAREAEPALCHRQADPARLHERLAAAGGASSSAARPSPPTTARRSTRSSRARQRIVLSPRGADDAKPSTGNEWQARFGGEVMRSLVTLQATIPLGQMTLGDIAMLQPGQLIEMPADAPGETRLAAKDKTLFVCEFGKLGQNYTVRIKQPFDAEAELMNGLLAGGR
jgi:hypothetical protein